jgi:hypothetical protein
MPNCYTLTPIGATEPEKLTTVDEKICAHFGATPDPVHYFHNWEANIGLMLAVGKTFPEIKKVCLDEGSDFGNRMALIADWLEANYTPDAWAEIGRRH